jgi:hypothetical protein
MEQWQHWMRLGNQAYAEQQLTLAQHCYRQALLEVWPIWYHCAFVHCPAELNNEEAALPTFCLSVAILNLAQSYQQQQRWRRCRSTLKQGLHWFEKMLEQQSASHPASIAVLQQSARLRAAYQHGAAMNAAKTNRLSWLRPQTLLH